MGTKRKLLISIITAILVVIGASTSMVVVFALTQQNLSSRIIVSFETVDVDGKVSAKYYVGANSAHLTTSTGETEIIFDAKDENTDNDKLSFPEGGVGLTTANDFIVIEYTFTNTGDVEYSAIMSYGENDLIVENMNITYSLDNVTYQSSQYGIVVDGHSSKNYYVKVELDNKSKDAYLKGAVNWLLEKYNGEADVEKINLAATDLIQVQDGTYIASYNGEDISINSGISALSSSSVQNLWYVPSRLGSAVVIGVKQGEALPQNTQVIISEGVTRIEDNTFNGCTGLIEITIPSTVSYLGSMSFYNCTNVKKIDYNTNLISDLSSANKPFYKVAENASSCVVNIGSNVTKIPENLFYMSSGITQVNLPSGLTQIGSAAFSGCSKLIEITIPSNVTVLGNQVFYGCKALTSITIPSKTTSIGIGLLTNCPKITSITVGNGNNVYHSAGNCLIQTESKTLIQGCKTSEIPADGSVTVIGKNAFNWCTELTEIVIPDSVKMLEDYAFYYCKSLETITMSKNVESIGMYAFENCEKLTGITLPETLISLGYMSFYNCYGLTQITIPASVKVIAARTFSGCSNLTSVEFKNTSGWWRSTSAAATSGTSISATDLANQTTAATYLKTTYREQYWKRG